MKLLSKRNIGSLVIISFIFIISAVLSMQIVFADDGDIASGDYWRITSDHELIIGQEGSEHSQFQLFDRKYPWWEYTDQITKISFRGKVYAYTDVNYFYSVFGQCRNSLVSVDLSGLDTSNVTNMSRLFFECKSLKNIDVCNSDTSNVTDMSSMFEGCRDLTSVDMSNFDTSKVISMSSMFYRCAELKSVNVRDFDTSNVKSINGMFASCGSLTSIDLSDFDTGSVTDMSYLFSECGSLTNIDVSNFNTGKVTNMFRMFDNCWNLTDIDVSRFDTSNVTNMANMFNECRSLTDIDVSGFDTSNVTNMANMFSGCGNLKSIDLSGFDTGNVSEMQAMFGGCGNLKSIDISSFDTSNAQTLYGFFFSCGNLTDIALGSKSILNKGAVDGMYENVDYNPNITWKRYKLLDGEQVEGPAVKYLSDYTGTDPGWYTSRNCPNGHIWNTTYTIDIPPTEYAPGSKSIHCSVCGAIKEGTSEAITQLPPSAAPAAANEIIDLPVVKISKPAAGKKKVTVKWKKVSKKNLKKIGGIQIQVATDPGFTNIVKTATVGKKKTSKTIKGLQSKTKYYVRIRAYAAGNHVSNWKAKSVKVK